MANFAYTENGQVKEVYDTLPKNWGRYSNFYLLKDDTSFLNSIGWYKIRIQETEYNSNTQKRGKLQFKLENDVVIQSYEIIDLEVQPEPEVVEKTEEQLAEEAIAAQAELERAAKEEWDRAWAVVRKTRDALMSENDWRYQRYDRETRLELTTTDSIQYLDEYMQALANITDSESPYDIDWPKLKPKDSE